MRCCKEIEKKKAGIRGLIKETGKGFWKNERGISTAEK